MSIRPSPREDILKIVKDFTDVGIGARFIADTLNITYDTTVYWLNRLITVGLVRREEGFVFRRPYYWWYSYYLVVEVPPVLPPPVLPPVLPPITAEYVHKALVYNVKTGVDSIPIDISVTFDYDVVNEKDVKDRLQRIAMLIAQAWLFAKFAHIPRKNEWAEESERPSDEITITSLEVEDEKYTNLHYKWTWTRGDSASEEAEGDMDWTDEMPLTGSLGGGRESWFGVRKGRKKV